MAAKIQAQKFPECAARKDVPIPVEGESESRRAQTLIRRKHIPQVKGDVRFSIENYDPQVNVSRGQWQQIAPRHFGVFLLQIHTRLRKASYPT